MLLVVVNQDHKPEPYDGRNLEAAGENGKRNVVPITLPFDFPHSRGSLQIGIPSRTSIIVSTKCCQGSGIGLEPSLSP